MLFLNGRTRNNAVSTAGLHNNANAHKVGRVCIVIVCLAIVTGLVIIIIGVISDEIKTKIIGIGLISFGVLLFPVTLLWFYGKFDVCYNNWIYRRRIQPHNITTIPPALNKCQSSSPSIKSPEINEKRANITTTDNEKQIDSKIESISVLSSSKINGTTFNYNNSYVPV